MFQVKIADLGVSNEFDGTDAFLTNTAGTPAFTGKHFENIYTISELNLKLAPECLSVNQGDSPYSGKVTSQYFKERKQA